MERAEALALLRKYNGNRSISCMALPSKVSCAGTPELGYGDDVDFWGLVGLLHDIDFEKYPEQHCKKAPELLAEIHADDKLIHGVVSHGYGLTVDVKPEHMMEKVLCAQTGSGLIWAPCQDTSIKSTKDMEVKSLKKIQRQTVCRRLFPDVIKSGAEMLGWDLNDLFEKTILAMRSCERFGTERMSGTAGVEE